MSQAPWMSQVPWMLFIAHATCWPCWSTLDDYLAQREGGCRENQPATHFEVIDLLSLVGVTTKKFRQGDLERIQLLLREGQTRLGAVPPRDPVGRTLRNVQILEGICFRFEPVRCDRGKGLVIELGFRCSSSIAYPIIFRLYGTNSRPCLCLAIKT